MALASGRGGGGAEHSIAVPADRPEVAFHDRLHLAGSARRWAAGADRLVLANSHHESARGHAERVGAAVAVADVLQSSKKRSHAATVDRQLAPADHHGAAWRPDRGTREARAVARGCARSTCGVLLVVLRGGETFCHVRTVAREGGELGFMPLFRLRALRSAPCGKCAEDESFPL